MLAAEVELSAVTGVGRSIGPSGTRLMLEGKCKSHKPLTVATKVKTRLMWMCHSVLRCLGDAVLAFHDVVGSLVSGEQSTLAVEGDWWYV